MRYYAEFFKTKEEANTFRAARKKAGKSTGIMYRRTRTSVKGNQNYAYSRAIRNDYDPRPEEWYAARPVCVAWNER